MRLLLTSMGVTNKTLEKSLFDLVGKPASEVSVVYIPTAMYGYEGGGSFAWQTMQAASGLGWKEFSILELTTTADLPEDFWLPALEAADVIWVDGGNGFYLSHWLQKSGLAAKLPRLLKEKVYVGVSAGSMLLTPALNVDKKRLQETGEYFDNEYEELGVQNAASDRTLNLVDFAIRPHLNSNYFPGVNMAFMEHAASKLDMPMYALDDASAVKVDGDSVEVVSEGDWKVFNK